MQVLDSGGLPLDRPLLPVVVSVHALDEPEDRSAQSVATAGRSSPVLEGPLDVELVPGNNGTVVFDIAVARAFVGARIRLAFRIDGSGIELETVPFTAVPEGFGPDDALHVSLDLSRPSFWWTTPVAIGAAIILAAVLASIQVNCTQQAVSTQVVGRSSGETGQRQGALASDEGGPDDLRALEAQYGVLSCLNPCSDLSGAVWDGVAESVQLEDQLHGWVESDSDVDE